MNTPTRSITLIALMWCAACAAPEDVATVTEDALETEAQALGAAQNNSPVVVLDSGHYGRYVYHGATSESFWVDLSVRNDTYQKEVGVVWTSDNWQTSQTTKASYEVNLGGGRERWGIDVKDFGSTWGGQGIEVEYAAYVKMNGVTSWSPFRNHYIYNRVTQAAPVRLLTSSVTLDSASEPVLNGSVRALNVPSQRKVFVRYSTNAWQSFAEAEATFDGKDFAFAAKLPFVAQSTEEVVFAVRLEAEGESHWDNNGGANYSQRLAPSFGTVSFQDDGLTPASGLRVLSGYAQTNLPVTAAFVRFDGGARIALPLFTSQTYELINGFSSYGSMRYAFPVETFSVGQHSAVVELAAGPFVRASSPVSFAVDDSIENVGTWDLSTGETPWDLEVTADGHAYVMRESRIDLYPALGALVPERVFASPAAYRLLDMTVDAAGRVYALSGGLHRFLASGELDTSFGNAGTLELTDHYAGRPLCYAANVEAVNNYLYINDSCNSRVLRFSFDGTFEAEVDLSDANVSTNVTRVFDDGEKLWVGYDLYSNGVLSHMLVAISDVSGQAPAVVDAIELDQKVQNLDAFALVDGGVWATTGWQQLYKLDSAGTFDSLWTGGGRLLTLPGAISIGRAISVLADGSIAVLSVDTAKVERFSTAQ